MLRFKNLLEAKEKPTRTGGAANTNGVRHELLVGGVLNHMSKFHKNPNAYSADGESADLFNMDDKQLRTHFDNHVRNGEWADKHMPEHFRSSEGQTPKEVHNRYTSESLDPEEHFKHFKNAVEHVKGLHKDLERRGFDPKSINNVAWTSVDGNVNSYMQKNANNPNRKINPQTDDADLMFSIKDKDGNTKQVGSSLKWGSQKNIAPTAKNNTHKTVAVEKEFGPEHADAIKEYQQNAQKEVDKHKNIVKQVYPKGTSDGIRKGIYDTDIEALKQNPDDERAKNNIDAVDDSYKRKSEAVAGHLHKMLTKIQKSPNGHEAIKQFVRNKLQIQNPDFVASRSRMTVDNNNNANSHHYEDHATSLNDHLNNTHHFNIERNGSTINIHAFDKDGKKLFTHKTWTKGNSRKSDAVTKWLHSSTIHDKDQSIQQENIGIKMSLNNLIENIVSGNLNESNVSFKSVLSEKVLEKLEEKKLSRKQKKLDKNHNGKLDSDDFKQIRGETGHCCSEESDLEEKYDDSGAYDQWDPKHPDFVKNYKKWKQANPDGKLDAFVSHMKNKPTQLPEETDLESQLRQEGVLGGIAGGILGAATGGPAGAIAGAYLGHKVQQGANAAKKIQKNQYIYKPKKPKRLAYEETDLESQLAEVLNPDQGVKAYIDDFQKSDDPRFEGDSKEQRRKRAIAAFYAAKKK